jgi:anti-anti-sigma factor
MEITTQRGRVYTEVSVKGRLDAYWADHLTRALDEVVRGGAHHVRLNLAGVGYISSMGVRVLVQFYQQLHRIHGAFVVANPSEPVKRVLDMTGLGELLIPKSEEPPAGAAPEVGRRVSGRAAELEVFECAPAARLKCTLVGDAAPLVAGGFRKEHSRTMTFPETAMAIGLGAFGNHFEDCEDRFGEFLSLAGAAAYQPTDGSNVPDYLIAEGDFVPEFEVLYSVVCDGPFGTLARFEAAGETGTISLSDLVALLLEVSGAPAAGIVAVAESAGLIGAALRRSPARDAPLGALFRYPEARRWLSFSPEHTHMHSLAVIAGVATRSPGGRLAPMVRPLGPGAAPAGHFHAAAFSYRPLKKGRIDLKATVRSVFEAETLQGVFHLLADDRESPCTQSEFVRGACWISPIEDVA